MSALDPSVPRHTISVKIAGEKHVLRSNVPPEYTRAIAEHVDATIRALPNRESLDPMRAATLASLSIADELFRVRDLLARQSQVEPESRQEGGEGITRSIEFPQEYYQAGVSILSYFGEVLKQKHPEIRAKVRIEQDGLIVRLQIDSESGSREIIEKTLEHYALVVLEQLPPESLFDSKLQVIALQQKLELARLEVHHTQQLLALSEASYGARIQEMQDELHHLRGYIGRQLVHADTLQDVLVRQYEGNERLQLAHVSHAQSLIQELARQAADNQALSDALRLIDQKLTQGLASGDEEAIKRALAVIHSEKPTAFSRLRFIVTNFAFEVGGNYLFKWIEAFAAAL